MEPRELETLRDRVAEKVHEAAATLDAGVVYMLTFEFGWSFGRSSNQPSLLHRCVAGGNVPTSLLLLSFNNDISCVGDRWPHTDESVLHTAAKLGQCDVIRSILSSAPRLLNASDKTGNTPLHAAACAGKLLAVRLLMNAGASKDAANRQGAVPWMDAVDGGHATMATELVLGATLARSYFGPLEYALRSSNSDEVTAAILEAMIRELGLSVDTVNVRGETLLHVAEAQHKPICFGLLSNAATPETRTKIKPVNFYRPIDICCCARCCRTGMVARQRSWPIFGRCCAASKFAKRAAYGSSNSNQRH